MSPRESQDLVNLMIEEIQNERNIDLCDRLFAVDFINHTPPRGLGNNRESMRQLFARTHAAFPDGRIEILDQIAAEGKVWTRKKFRGTHTGPFAGVPPSGKVIAYEVIDILAMKEGQFFEHWSVLDRLDLFEQLGLMR